jgi:hypothetical protein
MRSNVSTFAISGIALVGALLAFTDRHQSAGIAQTMEVASVEAVADAAAGVTFKIVPADVHGAMVSWAPLTGDGSN